MCSFTIGRGLGTSTAAAMVLFVGSMASAAPLIPGGTLSPIPGASLPAGAVQEWSKTSTFDFFGQGFVNTPNGPLPILIPMDGTVTQRVYRLTDNTILFSYSVSNASSSGDVDGITVNDWDSYTTDLTSFNGVAPITSQSVSSATRSNSGGPIELNWSTGLNFGASSRALYIRTNATAYSTSSRGLSADSRITVAGEGGSQALYGFAYPVEDSTPPVVSIASPNALGATCNPATITGTAFDPNGFDSYELEFQPTSGGSWTSIGTFSTQVSSTGTLATWNTASVAQGWYFLRLTAFNTSGLSSIVTTVVFVDKQFDTVDLRAPQTGNILGGTVCFDGTVSDGVGTSSFANYTINYAPLPAGSPFVAVDSGNVTYTTPIVNDGLGGWNTGSLADGSYRLRVRGTDVCGNTRTVTRDVTVDNTRPIALISSPTACSRIAPGLITINGVVNDANISGWVLQYTGGPTNTWVSIASGTTNMNGTLAQWNTSGLPNCAYTLRLIASDRSAVNCGGTTNQTEVTMGLNLGCAADFDLNGVAGTNDIFEFLNAWFAGCP